jgi:hypothetical protein
VSAEGVVRSASDGRERETVGATSPDALVRDRLPRGTAGLEVDFLGEETGSFKGRREERWR